MKVVIVYNGRQTYSIGPFMLVISRVMLAMDA